MTQKNLLIALITLIVAIFVFAQVYIPFAVSQISNQIVQLEARMDKRFTELETRIDKRFNQIETRLESLNQNYIDQLAHHIEK